MNNSYAGGFLHADDIRTLAISMDTLNAQVALVKKFAENNFLKLNVQKCEVVVFDRGQRCDVLPECEIDGSVLPSGYEGKCLGFWWRRDLLASHAVEENNQKARIAFFHFGSIGAFQGDLSPLSTRSVVETCGSSSSVYGCENWIVTERILQQLEACLGEFSRGVARPSPLLGHSMGTLRLYELPLEVQKLIGGSGGILP